MISIHQREKYFTSRAAHLEHLESSPVSVNLASGRVERMVVGAAADGSALGLLNVGFESQRSQSVPQNP